MLARIWLYVNLIFLVVKSDISSALNFCPPTLVWVAFLNFQDHSSCGNPPNIIFQIHFCLTKARPCMTERGKAMHKYWKRNKMSAVFHPAELQFDQHPDWLLQLLFALLFFFGGGGGRGGLDRNWEGETVPIPDVCRCMSVRWSSFTTCA